MPPLTKPDFVDISFLTGFKLPSAIKYFPPAELLEGGSGEDASESEDSEKQDAIEDEGMPDVDMAGEDDMRHALDLESFVLRLVYTGLSCRSCAGSAMPVKQLDARAVTQQSLFTG